MGQEISRMVTAEEAREVSQLRILHFPLIVDDPDRFYRIVVSRFLKMDPKDLAIDSPKMIYKLRIP